MNYYFITGSSKGLGKSLADLLLKEENNIVYGLARTCTIENKRYQHTIIDLSRLSEVVEFKFPNIDTADRIVLINNAGAIGHVEHLGRVNNEQLIEGYHVNLISPSIFMNNFMAVYSGLVAEKIVLNISSGAGRNPIDGWGMYCASKAGLDMLSSVLSEETNVDGQNVKVLSLAPGIIDTAMQAEIRKSKQSGFSNIDRFMDYKKDGDLVAALLVAKKVLRFLNEEGLSENTICSVRNLTN